MGPVQYERPQHLHLTAYVLLLPEWCVEHIVVYELFHLFEPRQNTRFHVLMDKYFPRWREAHKETHKICWMEEKGGSEYQSSDDE